MTDFEHWAAAWHDIWIELEGLASLESICPCNNCMTREGSELRRVGRSILEQIENRGRTREARMEEIERRRDTVLAECNPNLPTYEAK